MKFEFWVTFIVKIFEKNIKLKEDATQDPDSFVDRFLVTKGVDKTEGLMFVRGYLDLPYVTIE